MGKIWLHPDAEDCGNYTETKQGVATPCFCKPERAQVSPTTVPIAISSQTREAIWPKKYDEENGWTICRKGSHRR